ncbi:glycosyltransferase family 9 protein [Aquabacterium sp. OR-4]|uniref:glycosyltransferase family 9 protein n=1 Tax=Aquabacterium sp. OR-4 TaxID=2978127 RepID=UPI0021B27F38|nr:glycosyltransferase family 9 protein [Aquabacterium sp. OR-4]MDT7834733.1 glycosyltransferase family 9 protein [Aquabacterium sp. OR-4]
MPRPLHDPTDTMPIHRPLADWNSPHTADPDAPLVLRFAAVGDVVLLTALLAALAQRYGRPVHLLSSGAWTPVLLGHDPAVAELRLLSSRRAPYWLTPSQWAARRYIRAHRGPVYLCDPDIYAQRVIDGAGVPESRLVRAWQHWPGDGIHWVDWWLQIAALDAPAVPGPAQPVSVPAHPRLAVPPEWHAQAEAWLAAQGLLGRPLVLVQPGHKKTYKRGKVGTTTHDKHWPAEHWAAVIRGMLQSLPQAAVLLNGAPREAALVQDIIDAVDAPAGPHRLVNLAREDTPLSRLAALAARAHSMVSVDTGPAHVAGAMDCPLVALYGQAGWGRWKARAPHSTVIALGPEAPTSGARLMDLSPEAVLAAWRSLPARRAVQ